MSLNKKIYLSLIGLLSLGLLILLIFGFINSHPPIKKPSLTKQPSSTQQQEIALLRFFRQLLSLKLFFKT